MKKVGFCITGTPIVQKVDAQLAFVLGNGWKASVFLEVYGGGCYNVTELLHNQKGTKEKTAESVCIENENLLREEKGKSR